MPPTTRCCSTCWTRVLAAWWQQPPAGHPAAAGPASQPVPTKDKPVKLKAIITGVEGDLAEVRKSEADPWARAKVGMSVGEAAEFRTGPKSAIRFVIPPDHVYTVDARVVTAVLAAVVGGARGDPGDDSEHQRQADAGQAVARLAG